MSSHPLSLGCANESLPKNAVRKVWEGGMSVNKFTMKKPDKYFSQAMKINANDSKSGGWYASYDVMKMVLYLPVLPLKYTQLHCNHENVLDDST